MNEQSVGVELELNELLRHMVERGSSDLHLAVGVPPLLRIDGRLNRIEMDSLTGGSSQFSEQGVSVISLLGRTK
jgi:Tfp pilus assembly ATPase PilU